MFKPLKSVWKVDMTCHLRSDGLISSSVKVTLVVSDSTTPWSIYSPWNSPGQDTGVGSLSLLQGIFPTQGSNPGLLHCRQILYQLSHQGSPGILEGVVYPSPGDLPDPGIELGSPALQEDSSPTELLLVPCVVCHKVED